MSRAEQYRYLEAKVRARAWNETPQARILRTYYRILWTTPALKQKFAEAERDPLGRRSGHPGAKSWMRGDM